MIEGLASQQLLMAEAQVDTSSAVESESAEAAGEAFEGYLVEVMIREMRKTIPDGGLFGGSAMEMFSGLFDQEIAKRIAGDGGFGFGDVVSGQMPAVGSPEAMAPPPILPGSRRARADHGEGWRQPVLSRISSRFGLRSDPFQGTSRMHKGLDFAAPTGTPINPIKPGVVSFAGPRGGFGNAVIVDHGDGYRSVYAHCDEVRVQEGQRVQADSVIATVGSSGRSTGPHLHLEVHRDGTAVDPEQVLGSCDGPDHHHGHDHD